MKIVHIVSYFSEKGGGIEKMICDIYERVSSKADIEFVVFSYGKKNATKMIGNIRLRRLKGFKISSMSILPSLFVELIKEKPDVIHLHVPYPYGLIICITAKTVLRKALIVSYHTDPPVNLAISKIYKQIEPLLLRFADVVLATSNGYKKNSEILRKLKNVEVLRLGIDTQRFVPKQYPDEKIILTVGRKTFYKNAEMLTKAMEYVENVFSDVKLLIAGKDYKRKEDGNIKFLGYVSDEELLPLFQRGKPVIAFDLWGPSEVINDCGIIVEEKNAKALANAIVKLLKDEVLRKDMGRKARERVLEYFSLEGYDKMINIYKGLTSSGGFE